MNRSLVRTLLDLVIFGVAAHSIVLGLVLLSLPVWFLKTVGWEYSGDVFWPRQAGLFLMILGVAYGAAIRFRPLVWLLVGSKGCAIVFLLAHAIWLDAPKLVYLIGALDGAMGSTVALLYWAVRRGEGNAATGEASAAL